MTDSIHEDLKREHPAEGSSDRGFGLVLAGFFLLIGVWPKLFAGTPRWWALYAGIGAAVVALAWPGGLHPLNIVFTRLGLVMARVTNPLLMAILFYAVFTPFGLLVRLRGGDPLKLRFDREARSYWLKRQPPGPPPESMINQY